MPRLIVSNKNRPYRLEASNQPKWICQCGLSGNKPFCDGSHNYTDQESPQKLYQYSGIMNQSSDISGIGALMEYRQRNEDEIIFSDSSLQIFRLQHHSIYYQQVLNIRSEAGSNIFGDQFDQWSDIYLLLHQTNPVATMRVTQARDGLLDCESTYPRFINNFNIRKWIGSASRLYKKKDAGINYSNIYKFIIEVWKDQYKDGMRIDLINATIPMQKYYDRIGYRPVGETFIHPRTNLESRAMVYFAHSAWKCLLTNSLMETFRPIETTDGFNFEAVNVQLFHDIGSSNLH